MIFAFVKQRTGILKKLLALYKKAGEDFMLRGYSVYDKGIGPVSRVELH